jgi:hypothetical protein
MSDDSMAVVAAHQPTEEIRQVSHAVYEDFVASPAARHWMRTRKAICFYGLNQPARNVQIRGLRDAARTWRIPFYMVTAGNEDDLRAVVAHTPVLFITTLEFVSVLAPLADRCGGSFALIGSYYDAAPSQATVVAISDEEARILDEHRHRISLVLSESSPEGVEQYARGYIDRHGIPVMSFTWGINLLRHYPVPAATMASLVFLGSYFEKTTRIDAYFGEPFSKYTHSVVGYGWGDSPFDIADTMLDDFDATAPMLYSGHTVSLNIHHAYEEAGHTCNERSFNVPACGGFMISDNARRIRDFFPEDEAVLADGPADYHEKIDYFVRHPDERLPYMEKARKRVVAEHTYHHRLCDLLRFIVDGSTVYEHCPVRVAESAG